MRLVTRALLVVVAAALAAGVASARPLAYTLTVASSGAGGVKSTPVGITCPGTCSASFATGQVVTLVATASEGARFAGWSGDCSGTSTTCSVTMSADRAVTATFASGGAAAPKLTVTVAGDGTVTSSPAGISCPGACTASFATGTIVRLAAVPRAGATFAGWAGSCSGTATCALTMTADRIVTASFAASGGAAGLRTLTVTVQGVGFVTSDPAGISCPSTCSATFPADSVVELTATPAATTSFSAWSGACTGTGVCSVVVSASAQVTATFGGGSQPAALGAPPARLVLGGRTWRGVAGAELRGFIATFAASVSTGYVATIDWGDGKRSGGNVAPIFQGSWSVYAAHVYVRAGRYAVRVRVTRGGTALRTIHASAVVRVRPRS